MPHTHIHIHGTDSLATRALRKGESLVRKGTAMRASHDAGTSEGAKKAVVTPSSHGEWLQHQSRKI